MVDRNNGSAKGASLSDIFSSSGALPFAEELEDPGVYIPERAPGGEGGGRSGEYVIVHGAANMEKRSFDDDLCVLYGGMNEGENTSRCRRVVRTT